jgi:hypothetical protein
VASVLIVVVMAGAVRGVIDGVRSGRRVSMRVVPLFHG